MAPNGPLPLAFWNFTVPAVFIDLNPRVAERVCEAEPSFAGEVFGRSISGCSGICAILGDSFNQSKFDPGDTNLKPTVDVDSGRGQTKALKCWSTWWSSCAFAERAWKPQDPTRSPEGSCLCIVSQFHSIPYFPPSICVGAVLDVRFSSSAIMPQADLARPETCWHWTQKWRFECKKSTISQPAGLHVNQPTVGFGAFFYGCARKSIGFLATRTKRPAWKWGKSEFWVLTCSKGYNPLC